MEEKSWKDILRGKIKTNSVLSGAKEELYLSLCVENCNENLSLLYMLPVLRCKELLGSFSEDIVCMHANSKKSKSF